MRLYTNERRKIYKFIVYKKNNSIYAKCKIYSSRRIRAHFGTELPTTLLRLLIVIWLLREILSLYIGTKVHSYRKTINIFALKTHICVFAYICTAHTHSILRDKHTHTSQQNKQTIYIKFVQNTIFFCYYIPAMLARFRYTYMYAIKQLLLLQRSQHLSIMDFAEKKSEFGNIFLKKYLSILKNILKKNKIQKYKYFK